MGGADNEGGAGMLTSASCWWRGRRVVASDGWGQRGGRVTLSSSCLEPRTLLDWKCMGEETGQLEVSGLGRLMAENLDDILLMCFVWLVIVVARW